MRIQYWKAWCRGEWCSSSEGSPLLKTLQWKKSWGKCIYIFYLEEFVWQKVGICPLWGDSQEETAFQKGLHLENEDMGFARCAVEYLHTW